jgi:HEAT repeat protein
VETFLARLTSEEAGYARLAATRALATKIRESEPDPRWNMLSVVIQTMKDPSNPTNQRWQCCYVISGSKDERGIPSLIEVLTKDPIEIVRAVAAEALADFAGNQTAHDALARALQTETSQKVIEVINRRLNPSSNEYSVEQIRNTSAEEFLSRLGNPERGYEKFAAIRALGRKAKEADAQTRTSILSLVIAAMNDKKRTEYQRWQCCYVIGEAGDEYWVPYVGDILLFDPSHTMRSVAAETLGYFKDSVAALDALREASQSEQNQQVLDIINRRLNPGTAEYTAEQIASTPAETFIDRLQQPEPGYTRFSALHALGRKARESSAADRRSILTLVVTTMNDRARTEYQRFQCCYVICEARDEQWVPYLAGVLTNDPSGTMRAVAAEALAKFPNCADAHSALVKSLRNETNQRVIDVLNRVLGKTPKS